MVVGTPLLSVTISLFYQEATHLIFWVMDCFIREGTRGRSLPGRQCLLPLGYVLHWEQLALSSEERHLPIINIQSISLGGSNFCPLTWNGCVSLDRGLELILYCLRAQVSPILFLYLKVLGLGLLLLGVVVLHFVFIFAQVIKFLVIYLFPVKIQ